MVTFQHLSSQDKLDVTDKFYLVITSTIQSFKVQQNLFCVKSG